MYKKRHKWAPVYSRHIFHADMTTTDRAESINSFFTGYLNKSLPLSEFLEQYDMALVSRCEKETYEDFKSHQTRPVLKLDLPMEQQAADVYTRSVFKEFHKEFCDSFRYIASETERAGTNQTYVVSILGQNRNCLVNVNSSNNDFYLNCSCQKFEYTGILCRHVLKVFTVTNVMWIPEVYIKRRWTKKAKCGVVLDERVREVQADYLKSLGNGAGEEMSNIQPDIEGTRSLHLPAEVIMNIECSNHLMIEEIQTLSSVDQEILHNTPCVRTEGQPLKRTMSSLDKNQGEKNSRVEHKSSKHNAAPSLSSTEGVAMRFCFSYRSDLKKVGRVTVKDPGQQVFAKAASGLKTHTHAGAVQNPQPYK
ncbi:hypothetical protein HHK36_011238 [Tetracentron sinense]|uniref:Protein FAR1-RELATED SEQUENCE n=1 Tax=Tetracentron sinense TaxID=13715 RepID=A0A834Y6L7_TETSI|nr:hypothetical protein HHK36_031741 [Tetracentron sinense]KAF8403141.1 hypothetical protein HHK36_011238 [Tetracentron sinense]